MPPPKLLPHEQLVRTLPLRLQKFFALHPPQPTRFNTAASPSSVVLHKAISSPTTGEPTTVEYTQYNPFLPQRNPATGRWHPPLYSLRRQAELAKMAAAHGVEQLLPYTCKKREERARSRIEHGLQVRGTGVGRRVKGHKEERTILNKLNGRRVAMARMPGLIYRWKKAGHGARWKNWPK